MLAARSRIGSAMVKVMVSRLVDASWPNPHNVAAHIANCFASAQDQRASQFRAQRFEHLHNSFRASHCESPEHGPADPDGLCPKRDGLYHIGAAPDSAV